MIRRLRWALVVGAAAALTVLTGAVGVAENGGTTAPRAMTGPGSTIFIGVGGLTWSDVTARDTPTLWAMLRDGSSALVTVRSVYPNTCPVDGWLSLSAGTRAAADRNGSTAPADGSCTPMTEPTGDTVPNWPAHLDAAEGQHFGATPGLLGDTVRAAGHCVAAVGPGAAIGAAGGAGSLDRHAPFPPAVDTLTQLLAECPLTLVDVGSATTPVDGEIQPREIDQRVGAVIEAAPNGADIIMAGISDSDATSRLRVVAAIGPDFGPGTLVSRTTRQPGLVQLSDLTATLLAQVDADTANRLGATALTRSAAENNSETLAEARWATLTGFGSATHHVRQATYPFTVVLVLAHLGLVLLIGVTWWRGRGWSRGTPRRLRRTRFAATTLASVPAATFVAGAVPWWRAPRPTLWLLVTVVVIAVATAAAARTAANFVANDVGRRSREPFLPAGIVAGVTAVVLGVDALTGSRLQPVSLLGSPPTVGGRFYGFGNIAFAVFAAAALVVAISVGHWFLSRGHASWATLVVLVIGAGAVVIDGAPGWGADGGGPPALILAFGYLALRVLGVRLTWRRWLLLAAATVVVFLAIAFGDRLRPPESRSHLGRFADSLVDGSAGEVITRKVSANLRLLLGGNIELLLLVVIALVTLLWVLRRPTSWGARPLPLLAERSPAWHAGLVAVGVCAAAGFAVNDSGIAVPAAMAMVVVPLVIATCAGVLDTDVRTSDVQNRPERSIASAAPIETA